jgi:hypothetical protein
VTDQLHDALARSAGRHSPSPAPVAEILHAGRARRTRRRRVRLGAAACLTSAVLALSWNIGTGHGSGPGPGYAQPAAAPTAGVPTLSKVVGKGAMDGSSWSVALVYYATAPVGADVGSGPGGLVCLATSVNNKIVNPYGDCAGVSGPQDPSTDLGMYGQSQPTDLPGTIFYAQPKTDVAYATMTFTNGKPVTVQKVTIPGTDFSAYVVPIAPGLHMHGLNEYDSPHRVVGHQDF